MLTAQTSFGDTLRAARRRLGLTPAAVAAAAGCSRRLIFDLEHGRRAAPADLIPRLAAVLHLDAAWLARRQDAILLGALLPPGVSLDRIDLPTFTAALAAARAAVQAVVAPSPRAPAPVVIAATLTWDPELAGVDPSHRATAVALALARVAAVTDLTLYDGAQAPVDCLQDSADAAAP
jgi:transcriptional regulator with XRE-family HTH domain